TNYLRADDLAFGLIMAAGPAAMIFLFLGSYVAERTGRSKRNFLRFVSVHRLLWLVIAAVPLWLEGLPAGVRLVLVGVVVFTAQAMANYGGAGWSAWMADIVPRSIAGSYFGYRARLGMIAMVTVSTAMVLLLQRAHEAAHVYAFIFGLAAILGATDVLLFIPVREVPRAPEAKPPSLLDILSTPWRNSLFRGFVLYSAVSGVSYTMMGSFQWRFCFEAAHARGLGMSVLQTHLLLSILPMALMAWVAPRWGHAIDRFGPRPVLRLSALCAIVLPCVWAFASHHTAWLVWLAGAALGLSWPGIDQVNFYMTIKGFPDARRTTYNAAFQFVLGVASVAGSALGGVCASLWQGWLPHLPGVPDWMSHYQPVFLTAILLRLGAFVFIFPRLQLAGDAPALAVGRWLIREVASSLPGGRARRIG
ncbi:MAG: MFS transporter, partial [Armatimonadetes bacterium]|nr:MFS transporter [Armatimonadota bacterium]